MSDALLQVRDLTVRFGGLLALSDVELDVPGGTVIGLIGPNGAGKTTCFNVITGLQASVRGTIRLDGEDVTAQRPHQRARRGIGRTFQRLETFRTLTARENVLVAAEMSAGHRGQPTSSPSEVTERIIDQVGISGVADRVVETLPTGTQRLVELGRALAASPRVLLLDEPSSGLDDRETDLLGELLQRLTGAGLGILLVEHDMRFVMSICSHLYVLEFGKVIAEGDPASVQADPMVRAAYLGNGSTETTVKVKEAPRATPPSELVPAFELRDVTAGYGLIDVVHDVSLAVPKGSVLALLGPNGAGKSTTLQVASGAVAPTVGDVLLAGEVATDRSPDARARAGLCLIPEGRGVFPSLTVAENLLMATHTGTTSIGEIEQRAYERFPVLRRRRRQNAGSLSGGEQQMLAMARALATHPSVLLLDELSMGLAPLIVEQLYEEVAAIAHSGEVAIVVVEQFAHDVLAVADEALVMSHGRIVLRGSPSEVAAGMDAAYLGLQNAG